ncbi:MAG: hypothetical protein E7619_02380 [Ruminococcaceae bacterium]|nr:hypothetical protein [Oscillospiraceae bacterium]
MFDRLFEDKAINRHEYINAKWDENSGKSPDVMMAEMRKHFEDNVSRPYPVVFAEVFRYLFENGMLDINTRSPFPDKICNGVVIDKVAHAGILEKLSTEHYRAVLDKRIPGVRRMRELCALTGMGIPDLDVWHAVFDWRPVVETGFVGLVSRLEDAKAAKEASGELTDRQRVFYQSAEIALDAVRIYLNRLSSACREKGMDEQADIYAALTERRPETLYEVLCLQHVMLTAGEVARERIRSLGSVDQLWAPFYEADISSGRMSREEIKTMFGYFLLKIAAEERYADQPLCIGTDWSEDSVNCRMILDFLDIYQQLKIHNPKLHVRCSKNMPEVILRKLMEMTRAGASSIILYNDEVVFEAYEKIGIGREVSKNYLPIGCNETFIPNVEEMHICSSWINMEKAVEYAVTGGEDLLLKIYFFGRSEEPKTWEEFLETFYDYLRKFAEFTIDNINKQAPYSYETNPAPLLSTTFSSCVERGRDVFDCGLPLANESVKIMALGTTVDSLLAVKKFVYEQKRVTLAELHTILKNNWRGAELLRAEIKSDKIKWGNGEPEADNLAAEIYAFMAKQIVGKPTANGGVYRMGGDSVNFAERYGRNTGASPDGRGARAPLSKNIRPVNGCEHRGLSGLLASFAAIDFTDAADGAPCDFMMHPTAVEGEAGLDFMCSVIKIFFENKGFCIQGNVIDIETLLDAKQNPQNYPDLQVRVCGWNEYFVNMHPAVQSDFLKRASGGKYE